MKQDELGRKIYKEGDIIIGGSDIFETRGWVICFWEGSKYIAESRGFYYVEYDISDGGGYNFYIKKLSTRDVIRILVREGWSDIEAEGVIQRYKNE
jgi:hypothetical protein